MENPDVIFSLTSDSSNANEHGQSFLEMLNSGPSRSPSPVRPAPHEPDDANNPTLANWGFQIRQSNVSISS